MERKSVVLSVTLVIISVVILMILNQALPKPAPFIEPQPTTTEPPPITTEPPPISTEPPPISTEPPPTPTLITEPPPPPTTRKPKIRQDPSKRPYSVPRYYYFPRSMCSDILAHLFGLGNDEGKGSCQE